RERVEAADLLQREPRLLERADRAQRVERLGAVHAPARRSRRRGEQARALVEAAGGGGDARAPRQLADLHGRLAHAELDFELTRSRRRWQRRYAMTNTDTPLACDLGAIDADARDAFQRDARALLGSALELRDRPDGYALRIPESAGVLVRLARFVELDRRCCPFLRHGIEAEPEGGPIWLSFGGGPAGAKEAIAAELRGLLPPALAARL